MLTATMKRLEEARRNAGLTQRQTERLLVLPEGMIKQFETEELDISLRHFLLLCETYDVSPVWALLGVNPMVDVTELKLLLHSSRMARNDIDAILKLIETMPSEAESQVTT